MSTQYPILDNRPIGQWKVAELKEELKRRKLPTRGLKDDLIRRLDEALRSERMEEEERELDKDADTTVQEEPDDGGTALDNDEDSVDAQEKVEEEKVEEEKETVHVEKDIQKEELADGPGIDLDQEAKHDDVETTPIETDTAEDTGDHQQNGEGDVDDKTEVVNVDGSPTPNQSKDEDAAISNANESDAVADAAGVLVTSVETNVTITQSLVTEVSSSTQLLSNEIQAENEDSKPSIEDAALEVTSSNNQVSEVSPVLGSQIRSESISNESVSINEKIELKDNLNADNVHLELEVTMPEMVQPSSSAVLPEGGDVHPLDGPEPPENQSSVEEANEINASIVDIQKNNHGADSGSPEKLNLDRSSGDDSMEEDVVEKHIDSTHNSDEVEEKNKDGDLKEETLVDVVEDGQKDFPAENKSFPSGAATDKRKAEVQEVAGNHEQLPKRQRRWNSENLKIPETAPKETFSSVSKSTFSRSNSTLSGGDTPKERVVPPSPKSPTNSLRIDNFLRPFTLKAVQELLGKTGTVGHFWMDHIKTHCYVTYSSVEEAIETRNALYNLQWPPNGGKLLAAEFVDQQEVKTKVEAPSQQPAAPVTTGPSAPTQPPAQPQPTSRQQVLKQPLPPAPPLPSPKQRPIQTSAKDRLNLPPPPPLTQKPDPPIVTLDDLFRKTKAAPRIYYLPLSDEQVAAKLTAQGRNNN